MAKMAREAVPVEAGARGVPIDQPCIVVPRTNSAGQIVWTQLCTISGTDAKFIIVGNTIRGITGAATQDDVLRYSGLVTKHGTDVLEGFVPM